MTENNVFLRRGAHYQLTAGNFDVQSTLDDGIYKIIQNPVTGELSLVRIADSFEFGFKVYGLDTKFVNHVVDTYNKQEIKRNIGVLLNGPKGTGKTVTAKQISNRLGLPIIICDVPYDNLTSFLCGINHDCIFFFDEFEKNFGLKDANNYAGETLLSLMDGVYSGNNYSHIFIFTTNELDINPNMISRPSRVRYVKTFNGVLPANVIEEIVDDSLKYPEFKNEIIDFIDRLEMATIDIVKSIIEEVNIHRCSVEKFSSFFNVQESCYKYYIYKWAFNPKEKNDCNMMTKDEFIDRCSNYYDYTDKNYLIEQSISAVCGGDFDFKYDGSKNQDVESLKKKIVRLPKWGSLTTAKSAYKYKPNDVINGSWKIDEVDIENKYMLCTDLNSGMNDTKIHLYFTDIDAKPSLAKRGVIDGESSDDCYGGLACCDSGY